MALAKLNGHKTKPKVMSLEKALGVWGRERWEGD